MAVEIRKVRMSKVTVMVALVLAMASPCFGIPITEGTFTSADGETYSIFGSVNPLEDNVHVFCPFAVSIYVDGFDPILSMGGVDDYNEIHYITQDHLYFEAQRESPDPFHRYVGMLGVAYYSAESLFDGEGEYYRRAEGITYNRIEMSIIICDYDGEYHGPVGTIDLIAESVPVPEPATIFLLTSGLIGLVTIKKRLGR